MSLVMRAPARVLECSVPMTGAFELIVEDATAAAAAKPGQFFQLAVQAPHTILRRPYSVAWSDKKLGRLGFIFNVVGAGSAWLASSRPGGSVDLLGPLGQGFNIDGAGRAAVCIAGGLGVAPFPALVSELRASGRQVTFLQGARTADRLLPESRLGEIDQLVATEDGSLGRRGNVLDLLDSVALSDSEVFACGPTPMLRGLIDAAERLELPLTRIQVALETPMGCGSGTCLGCVAPRRGGGYLLTCTDGPCLRADRIDWDRMDDAFHG